MNPSYNIPIELSTSPSNEICPTNFPNELSLCLPIKSPDPPNFAPNQFRTGNIKASPPPPPPPRAIVKIDDL